MMKTYNLHRILHYGAILFLAIYSGNLKGQELNVTVTVNSDHIQSPNKNVFTTLQTALTRLVSETRWTNAEIARNERIDCSFSLSILEETSAGSYKAELFISARRPVYNASYITTTVNYRDKNVEFDYTENQTLELNQSGIDNNLVAIIAFYCNLILAKDFDSFSPLGGGGCYRQAQTIAMQAQSNNWEGWSTFDDNRSRSSIINCFLDESMKQFRELWYTYHRRGLDEMAANADRGRTTIIAALLVLKETRKVRNSEIVLQMFADCKLEEIIQIAEKASQEERKNLYDLLRNVFPGTSNKLEPLTK
ncbi:MAG: DUF4835 family protein [Dysgonamonadaceae bacterium]|jgi:hypothetical protein|nr:DUF4835 family protein [Dysgonamonadaceae bacterium]